MFHLEDVQSHVLEQKRVPIATRIIDAKLPARVQSNHVEVAAGGVLQKAHENRSHRQRSHRLHVTVLHAHDLKSRLLRCPAQIDFEDSRVIHNYQCCPSTLVVIERLWTRGLNCERALALERFAVA